MPKGWNDQGELVDFAHTCPKCGEHCPLPSTKICKGCGTKQLVTVADFQELYGAPNTVTECPECGTERGKLSSGHPANFCSSCGYKYEGEK